MKKIFATLSLFVITIATFAEDQQSFHFGIKASPSLAWFKSDSKGYEPDGSKFGFTYGLITEFNFASRYAFATGIDVTYRGGKFKSVNTTSPSSGDSTVSTSSNYTLQYIEIPITLKLKTNEIGSLTYFAQIGLTPGINISAKMDYTSNSQFTAGGVVQNTSSNGTKVDVQKQINNFNLSMVIGGGVEYTLSGQTVLLAGLQFNNGFLDAFDGDPKVNTNFLALTLGVLF